MNELSAVSVLALEEGTTNDLLIAAARITNPYITDEEIQLGLPQWKKFLAAIAFLQAEQAAPSTLAPHP